MALNKNQTPPGGWQFYQPQTGWREPTPVNSTLNQVVTHVIAMRKKNPAITAKHKLATTYEVVEAEVLQHNIKRLGLTEAAPVPFPVNRSLSEKSAAGAAVARVKKLAAGAALLMEWEESGRVPVSQELAEKRAAVCADCPKNEKGSTLSEYFTVPAAELIRKRMARLNSMNLTTSKNEQLNVCTACLCPLALKVFCPGDLINKRMTEATKADLDPRCWITKE